MDHEKAGELLLKAIDSACSGWAIISSDLKILASSSDYGFSSDKSDCPCHDVLNINDKFCQDCGVSEVIRTSRPTFRHITRDDKSPPGSFRHILPIIENGEVKAAAVLEFQNGQEHDPLRETSNAEQFLRNLLMSSVDGIIASDMTGKILIFNEAASQITGFSRDEALTGLDIRDIYPEGGAKEVMRRLRIDDFGGVGKLKSFRADLKHKDGIFVPINLSAAVVYEYGKEAATVGFFYDLREKLRMEQELQEAQVQLMQAEKMSSLGKLSAGVAHQLNNPLGSILLFAKLILEDYELPPGADNDIQRIIDDTERCQVIVTELLDFARQSTMEMRLNDLNRALARTIFLLESQPLFKEIEIVKDFAPDLPKAPSDLQQLNHVFMNIILNAADAMEGRGRLYIGTRLSPGGDSVQIEISDTGQGIPGQILPHIFDPFFTTKDEGKGTGLGLSVAYGVIRNHGGRITACSAPGEGTSFVIEIPTNVAASEAIKND